VFCADVLHMTCELHEFISAVVWLPHNAFVGFGDVMFDSNDVLKTESLPDIGGKLNRLIADRVGEVEPDKWRGTVVLQSSTSTGLSRGCHFQETQKS
jgi:hypothetical protein